MSKMNDLSNQRFGKLVAIEPKGRKNKKIAWLCQCDCGNETIVASDKLRNGHTQSCGCLVGEKAKERVIDLTGHKYGRWTVIENAGYKNKEIVWKCICECGNVGYIASHSLRTGNSKSCGCLAKELTSIRNKENPIKKPIIDLKGKRFGNLIVVEMEEHIVGKHVTWKCKCDCGNKIIVDGSYLRNGQKTHCGCNKPFSYRLTHPRLYRIWQNMRERCGNPKNNRYYDYGGRGIKVCTEWQDSFETFCKWALENGYGDELSIDRIDVNGNYEPSNCRWITMFDQMGNTRKNVYITYKGETKHLSEWCRILNFKQATIDYRLKNGYSVEEAFETPIGKYERTNRYCKK